MDDQKTTQTNQNDQNNQNGQTNQDDQGQSAQPKLKEQGPFDSAQGKIADKKVAGIDVSEADKVAKEEGDEYWENYSREIELEKEILEMGGVEKVESGEMNVPEELASEMGIRPTTTVHTPIAKAAGFSVGGVSLDDNQLTLGSSKSVTSAFRWLVEWFIYQLRKAHYHIQKMKGKIVRTNP